jgi:NADH pyrophosphatase NudC (nudix superfamily)
MEYRFVELRKDPEGNVTVRVEGDAALADKVSKMKPSEQREFMDRIEAEMEERFSSFNKVFVEFDRMFERLLPQRLLGSFLRPLPRTYELLPGGERGRYCPYCGEELKEEYRYCPGCGKKI